MNLSHRLAISYYKTIAVINETHKVFLVQHQENGRIFIKKILDVYNIDVYNRLFNNPINGIPRIIDYFEDNSQLTVIEEYVSGTPLTDKLVQHDISDTDILNYSLDLCSILEKLHAFDPPVIHRDIKPSNIIITDYNRPVLLDFNAAKQFSSDEPEDTVLLGTQGYAAPEQYGFGSSSPQTDIYSLGIVIKEMMASGFSSSSVLHAIAEKCTQLDPKERYGSVRELKKELSQIAKHTEKKTSGLSPARFLPPGYRTRTPWKIFLSSVIYLFITALCLSLEVSGLSGPALWTERILCLAMMLSVIFGCFNYMNIQRFVPLCRSRHRLIRFLGIAILDLALIFALMLILLIADSVVFHIV